MLKNAGKTSFWLGTTLILVTGCGSLPTSAKGFEPNSSTPPSHSALTKGSENSKTGKPGEVIVSPEGTESKPTKNMSVPGESCPTLEVVSRILQKDLGRPEKPNGKESFQVSETPKKTDPEIQTVSFQGASDKSRQEAMARDKAFPLISPPVSPTPPVPKKAKVLGNESEAKTSEIPTTPPGILPPSVAAAKEPGTSGKDTGKNQPAGQDHFQFTKLILCKKVEGFGQYEPVKPGYKFNPGSRGQPGERVLLYAEMNNPPGRMMDGLHRTNLCGEVEILRQNDQTLVCKLGFPGREDSSRTPRKDHHLVYSFHVPPGLPPGTYTLRVNARDCSGGVKENRDEAEGDSSQRGAKASASVDFQVDVGRTGGESSLDTKPRGAVGGLTP